MDSPLLPKKLGWDIQQKVQKERIKGKGRQRGQRAGKEGIATSNSTCAAELLNKIEYKGISIIVDTQNSPDKLSQNSAEFTI
jgi:hypothetical protein